ncbi:hypothetical protein K432DRAFT_388015 [Lepidopterella palustris CBS 459.81]|uniref:Uncharacterized protein n=1 Tax=Lepidopterella palustris CBS 459.81 TaxID=1314670 RepID=A0A8E2ELF9_9PEZI|nr:hypothetical protein K432DRAFT_388015 [Lepidopterella palustris CBS 459.81]
MCSSCLDLHGVDIRAEGWSGEIKCLYSRGMSLYHIAFKSASEHVCPSVSVLLQPVAFLFLSGKNQFPEFTCAPPMVPPLGPTILRRDIRDIWNAPDRRLQTALGSVNSLLPKPVILEPDWSLLCGALSSNFTSYEMEGFVAGLTEVTLRWCEALKSRLEDTVWKGSLFHICLGWDGEVGSKAMQERRLTHVQRNETIFLSTKMQGAVMMINIPKTNFSKDPILPVSSSFKEASTVFNPPVSKAAPAVAERRNVLLSMQAKREGPVAMSSHAQATSPPVSCNAIAIPRSSSFAAAAATTEPSGCSRSGTTGHFLRRVSLAKVSLSSNCLIDQRAVQIEGTKWAKKPPLVRLIPRTR